MTPGRNIKPCDFRDGLHSTIFSKFFFFSIIPHFTFILKHIYSEDRGVHKLVLISVPHCSIQPQYFPDINIEGGRMRTAKAKDEFRFNMNDSQGNPYTFLGTNEPRYHVFTIMDDINYE